MQASEASIRQVKNGYIVTLYASENVCPTLESVFEELLLFYEGRAFTFNGKMHGRITIERGHE